jgi:serine/threonine protein kinase
MGKQEPLPEVDPQFLPLGTRVGPWRVTGFRGRGACGTLYRVEHTGRETAGPFALKLAHCPSDPRFENEARLLSLIHSPHVPQFIDYGVWEHASGAYPFLVMQLVFDHAWCISSQVCFPEARVAGRRRSCCSRSLRRRVSSLRSA